MSLATVLSHLDGARVSLANKLTAKGVTVPANITINGAAELIDNLPNVGAIDVSDTTATAANVLAGSYFYTAAGVKTQGTITSISAQTITPTTTDQTIAAGNYLSGALTIKGDANLTAANIASGVTIFGVTGSHQGGSSMDFYKCASVFGPYTASYYTVSGAGTSDCNGRYDKVAGQSYYAYTSQNSGTTYYLFYQGDSWVIATSTTIEDIWEALYYTDWEDPTQMYAGEGESPAPSFTLTEQAVDQPKTWTGYKATLANGKYSFAGTATTGLTWTTVKPVVGEIYSDDALIRAATLKIEIPSSGMVFFAPLSADSATAQTGQTLTAGGEGSITFATHGGIPAAYFDGDAYLDTSIGTATGTAWTLSLWAKADAGSDNRTAWAASAGDPMLWTGNAGRSTMEIYPTQGEIPGSDQNSWAHYAIVCVGDDNVRIYVNGIQKASFSSSGWRNYSLNSFYIGRRGSSQSPWKGRLAACRIYNRVLNENEIAALATEFQPTA